MRAIFATALAFMATGMAYAACDDNLPATGSRDDVLIIVNDNAIDSCEIGRYYAEKRQLGRSNILHVKTPANPTISYGQYELLRDQIIRNLQQKLVGITLAICSPPTQPYCPATVAQLQTQSAIRYVVTTKGVPARITQYPGENWVIKSGGGSNEAGSVDGYLRWQMGGIFYPGRIDGIDLSAAKRLVDRAIDNEKSGWFGNLLSAATRGDGAGPGGDRFAKTGYHPFTNYANPVHSERLDSDSFLAKINQGFIDESHQHWRYQFALFGENNDACTGNTSAGAAADFYLNKDQSIGKAPDNCKVKLVKGIATSYNEMAPGFAAGRMPAAVNAVAYLGHLDDQATLSGHFENILNWKKDPQCGARLCADAVDASVCRAASTDVYKELDTRCVGVADGFIGHNFQSYSAAFFAGWPTAWQPLDLATTTGSKNFGIEIAGSDLRFRAYPLVKDDDGDNDAYSVWFGAHDKIATTTCYQRDLISTETCRDLNNLQIGQIIAPFAPTPIGADKYYRLSLSYRSLPGETQLTAALRAMITVRDPHLIVETATNNNHRALPWVDATTVTGNGDGPLRDAANNAALLGANSMGWKRVSATFKLAPSMLAGSPKTIDGMSVILFNSDSFSGLAGIDRIVLEEVDSGGNAIQTLPIRNGDFQGGHNQFSVGDWAATFTSRLNGTAFWGSVDHNCGGTLIYTRLADTLAGFISGDSLAKAVWQQEDCYGGLLYGDPLYSPLSVQIRPRIGAASAQALNAGQLPLTIDAMNGSDGSKVTTQYGVEACHSSITNPLADFYLCDREGGWIATNLQGTGPAKNIALTLDATQFPSTVHTLRLSVTSAQSQTGKVQTFRGFLTFFGIGKFLSASGDYDTDGDGLIDENELYRFATNPLDMDSDDDGLNDGDEVNLYHSAPLLPDTDGDGLSDGDEAHVYNSDPTKIDSDGDGRSDMQEIIDGTSPSNPASYKVHMIPPVLWQRMVE